MESIIVMGERKKMADGVNTCADCMHFRADVGGCAAVITIDLVTGDPLMTSAIAERYGAKGFTQSCGEEGKLWKAKLNG